VREKVPVSGRRIHGTRFLKADLRGFSVHSPNIELCILFLFDNICKCLCYYSLRSMIIVGIYHIPIEGNITTHDPFETRYLPRRRSEPRDGHEKVSELLLLCLIFKTSARNILTLFSRDPSQTVDRLLIPEGPLTMISTRAFVAPVRQCLRRGQVAPSCRSPLSQVRFLPAVFAIR
jgi:hypothetical protein